MFTKLKRLIFPTTRYPLMMDRLNKDHYECDISGTKFSVDTFPSNMGFDHSKDDITRVDLDNPNLYINRDHKYEHLIGQPLTPGSLMYRRPEIRRGFLGRDSMYMLGVGLGMRHLHTLPEDMNLFYPPHFQQAIEYFHYFADGPSKGPDKHRFYTNWRYRSIGGKRWWSFHDYRTDVRKELEDVNWDLPKLNLTDDNNANILNMYRFEIGTMIMIPIGRCELLAFGLSMMYPYAPIEDAYAAFEDFAEELFSTVKLDYGPRAIADRSKLSEQQLNNYPELDPTFCLQKEPHIFKGDKKDIANAQTPEAELDRNEVFRYGDKPPIWRP